MAEKSVNNFEGGRKTSLKRGFTLYLKKFEIFSFCLRARSKVFVSPKKVEQSCLFNPKSTPY